MIKIDRLKMNLPKKFTHRASSIAYKVGELLSKQRISKVMSLDKLTIKKRLFVENISDDEIASQIVMQIMQQLKGKT